MPVQFSRWMPYCKLCLCLFMFQLSTAHANFKIYAIAVAIFVYFTYCTRVLMHAFTFDKSAQQLCIIVHPKNLTRVHAEAHKNWPWLENICAGKLNELYIVWFWLKTWRKVGNNKPLFSFNDIDCLSLFWCSKSFGESFVKNFLW